jgi:serine protease Do
VKQPVVIETERNSAASNSGLRVGDVILDVNKKAVEKSKDVLATLKKGPKHFACGSGRTYSDHHY